MTSFGHEGDRLSAFLDDELDDRDALTVTRHLRHCGPCRRELEDLRATREALRGLPTVQPSLSWMVETAVLGPGDASTSRWAAVLLGTFAMTLTLLGLAYAIGGQAPGTVEPPVGQLVVDHVRSVEGGPVVTPVMLESDGDG